MRIGKGALIQELLVFCLSILRMWKRSSGTRGRVCCPLLVLRRPPHLSLHTPRIAEEEQEEEEEEGEDNDSAVDMNFYCQGGQAQEGDSYAGPDGLTFYYQGDGALALPSAHSMAYHGPAAAAGRSGGSGEPAYGQRNNNPRPVSAAGHCNSWPRDGSPLEVGW